MISGAEVVTGGASAAYGSDAVAGVVNFKIDHKLEGVRGNAQYGISNYGDNKSYLASAAAGTKFAGGRGHIIVGAEMAQSKGILDYGEREWGDYATIANPASTPTNTAPTFILVNQPRTSNASYGGLIADSIFFRIREGWHVTHDQLLDVTGQARLLEKHPALESSIRLRLPYIEPLNLLQVELLKRHRAGESDPKIEQGILLSINAIATGLRNSG